MQRRGWASNNCWCALLCVCSKNLESIYEQSSGWMDVVARDDKYLCRFSLLWSRNIKKFLKLCLSFLILSILFCGSRPGPHVLSCNFWDVAVLFHLRG